jgi:hypothetical protein
VTARPSAGYLYIVLGDVQYFEEALRSVHSLKTHDPEGHATLVTDTRGAAHPGLRDSFDDVVVRTMPEANDTWRQAKVFKVEQLRCSPYEQTLFIDSDTLFLANCRCLFDPLEHYDICLALATGDQNPVSIDGVPTQVVKPYNTGVMAFRSGEAMDELWGRWSACYHAHADDCPLDQPSFVESLTLSSCRAFVFRNNWNARFNFPDKYVGGVSILHGRHADLEKVARRINVTSHPRLWIPWIDSCLGRAVGVGDYIRAVPFLMRYACQRIAKRLLSRQEEQSA